MGPRSRSMSSRHCIGKTRSPRAVRPIGMHPPTGTLSVFARSACALRNSVPFAGLLSDCADAAVASSKIKLASKSFIRISFYANDFAYHGAARNINRRMPVIRAVATKSVAAMHSGNYAALHRSKRKGESQSGQVLKRRSVVLDGRFEELGTDRSS